MPNFVNAGLCKVYCLGNIPKSHGAINNVSSFAVEPELKNKQNKKWKTNKQNYTWQWLQQSAGMQLSQTIMQISFWFTPPRWLLLHQKVDNLQCWVQSEKQEQNVQDSKETKS